MQNGNLYFVAFANMIVSKTYSVFVLQLLMQYKSATQRKFNSYTKAGIIKEKIWL